MGMIPVKDRSWRPDTQENFLRGFAWPARDDSEGEAFLNVELNRDGALTCRLGCYLYNTDSVDSSEVLGFGRQQFSGGDTLVVAKDAGDFYYATATTVGDWSQPRSFGNFTTDQTTSGAPVSIEACTKSDETPIVVFTCVNSTGLAYWDGSAGAATDIASSPANCAYLKLSGARMYASGCPTCGNRIFYSNNNDPLTWPSTQYFDIDPSRGPITGLAVSSGTGATLVIFTQRSVQLFFGDPAPVAAGLPSNWTRQTAIDGIGIDMPLSLATKGSVTVFAWDGNAYSFSGAVQDLTEMARGLMKPWRTGADPPSWRNAQMDGISQAIFSTGVLQVTPNLPTDNNLPNLPAPPTVVGYDTAMAITATHIFARPGLYLSGSPTTPNYPSMLYAMDRERSGWVSIWTYSSQTGFGASNPKVPSIYALDNFLLMGGGDGNIYLQPVRQVDLDRLYGTQSLGVTSAPQLSGFTQDYNGIDVYARYRSRLREQGNPTVLKQARDIFLSGACKAGTCSVSVNVLATTGNNLDYSTAGLPCAQNISIPASVTFDLSNTTVANYYLIAFEVTAANMYLYGFTINYRTRMMTGTAVL